jgi:hypothetical protein
MTNFQHSCSLDVITVIFAIFKVGKIDVRLSALIVYCHAKIHRPLSTTSRLNLRINVDFSKSVNFILQKSTRTRDVYKFFSALVPTDRRRMFLTALVHSDVTEQFYH